MLTDIKLAKAEIFPKIMKSGRFLDAMLGKFAGPLMRVAVLLGKHFWHHQRLWYQFLQ